MDTFGFLYCKLKLLWIKYSSKKSSPLAINLSSLYFHKQGELGEGVKVQKAGSAPSLLLDLCDLRKRLTCGVFFPLTSVFKRQN